MPVLTKGIIRAHWHELRAENIPDKATFIAQTGGSTGEPMRIAKVLYSEAWANMCYERGLSWGGLAPGMKHIELWRALWEVSSKRGVNNALPCLQDAGVCSAMM
jgi:phenylacetate-coenzyme A ligase PaaK-like adenylate-forming protein